MVRNSITRIKHWSVKHLAATYIVGPQVADAIQACRRVAEYGWCSTICPWNDPNDPPETVASSYRLALKSIICENLDCYLSIKAPALRYDFQTLKNILELARDHGVRIHFDAQHPESASPSFTLLERAVKIYQNLGCTLPSRWRRSISDAARAIDLGIPVRVVKGAWPDPAEPDLDPRARFLDLIDVLAGRAQVAVATHDASLAAESLRRLRASGTSCQLEQLFGLPIRAASVAKPLGVTVRVYIPYGQAFLPYAISQVRKRPIILAWILRDFLLGKNKI